MRKVPMAVLLGFAVCGAAVSLVACEGGGGTRVDPLAPSTAGVTPGTTIITAPTPVAPATPIAVATPAVSPTPVSGLALRRQLLNGTH